MMSLPEEPMLPFERLRGAGESRLAVTGRQLGVQDLLHQISDEGEASFVSLDQSLVTIET